MGPERDASANHPFEQRGGLIGKIREKIAEKETPDRQWIGKWLDNTKWILRGAELTDITRELIIGLYECLATVAGDH